MVSDKPNCLAAFLENLSTLSDKPPKVTSTTFCTSARSEPRDRHSLPNAVILDTAKAPAMTFPSLPNAPESAEPALPTRPSCWLVFLTARFTVCCNCFRNESDCNARSRSIVPTLVPILLHLLSLYLRHCPEHCRQLLHGLLVRFPIEVPQCFCCLPPLPVGTDTVLLLRERFQHFHIRF